MDIMGQLRLAIDQTHQDIENLPYSRALLAGQLHRPAYLVSLGQLYHLHLNLECELGCHPQLLSVYRPGVMARGHLIERDLAALGGQAGRPAAQTTRLITRFRAWSEEAPCALLGALYVFEGSRLGSLVLARSLARSLGVPAEPWRGLDYHIDAASERPRLWGEFKTAMNAVMLSDADRREVVDAAAATMSGLYDLYAALSASDDTPTKQTQRVQSAAAAAVQTRS